MANQLLLDTFDTWTGWSGAAFAIDPAGAAHAVGGGSGTPVAYRTRPSGGVYLELVTYMDSAAGDSWAMVTTHWGTDGAAYNNNGFSFLIRRDGQILTVAGGNLVSVGRSLVGQANKVRWGIHYLGAGAFDVYIERAYVASYTFPGTWSHDAKANIAIGAYNGIWVHHEELSVWDGVPAPPAANQEIYPTGIATAEAFGTPTVTFDQAIAPSGIASAETFGTPVMFVEGGAQTLQPTGIASAEAFGVASILAGLTEDQQVEFLGMLPV